MSITQFLQNKCCPGIISSSDKGLCKKPHDPAAQSHNNKCCNEIAKIYSRESSFKAYIQKCSSQVAAPYTCPRKRYSHRYQLPPGSILLNLATGIVYRSISKPLNHIHKGLCSPEVKCLAPKPQGLSLQ